jgi:hypothetical protein
MLIRGDKLNPAQRRVVLRAFLYRWTRDNTERARAWGPCPACDIHNPAVNLVSAGDHRHPTIPLETDEQWLRGHAFHFTQDGTRLMENRKYAEPVLQGSQDVGQAGLDVLSRHGGK